MDSQLTKASGLPGCKNGVAPSPPSSPFYDPTQNAWVLSRHQDVLAALREPAFRQAGPQKAPTQVRKDVLDSLSQPRISEWQAQIETLSRRMIRESQQDGTVDLINHILRPWCGDVAGIVLGLDRATRVRLAALESYLANGNAGGTAGGLDPVLSRIKNGVGRKIAKIRLEKILRNVRIDGAHSLFLGLSQTLPDFLANAWLALLENPSQLLRLRAEPHLMPRAIEELLRYAGPVHTLLRDADRAVEMAGVTIAKGDRVSLKVAQANRDPTQFPHPNSLDLTRRSAGHLALGLGAHSCAGAQLLRMAAASATSAFADHLALAQIVAPVTWRRGSVLDSPASLTVTTHL